ncbi:type VII secretion-associated protein [Candidatus Mycobacterium methanotrophicum]|uniref:Type VII secretion-associated protein n=1 Tax=Candidatus Mycobacterium methanotrophicum TaxID=2943498 RepID=A0ABY4QKZ2_9MYCO|nr:type VII secretion-associated protein [Candidatus Mycobacterium methanotrophicum]UQX10506.1 type VII secretion-associated protein [Candidatus Mycobacterium methanotrophicum]
MSTHVVEVGPNSIRELCCSGAAVDDDGEMVRAAFDSIDDPVALLDLRPVSVDWLWRTVLGSHACGGSERAIVVHPSWWAPTRIARVGAAADTVAGEVALRPRSWLLIQASPLKAQHATVVVEIADCFVVITGAAVVAESRCGEPELVAQAVMRSVREMTSDVAAAVVIDAPDTVAGAGALAAMIADGLRAGDRISAVHVDDARLRQLAAQTIADESTGRPCSDEAARPGYRRYRGLVLLAMLLIVAVSGALLPGGHRAPAGEGMPMTFLVEGHVALEVPAQWPMQRVVGGPGSARVQVTSPSDPEVALHVTQSRVAVANLSATAESLKRAIDAEPTGVFVDFNPVGASADRPAVTYRERRPGHDIQWIVLVDKAVRISIGCQSRHGRDDAVRQVCERAVRSARAVS